MKTEYEARFFDIDVERVIAKLHLLGATDLGEKEMKRYIYDLIPASPNKWVRLRDNGRQITLAFKNMKSDTIDGIEEFEIIVEDFEKTHQFLKALGYVAKNYQENRRHSFELDGVCIDIDTWPLIPTYCEIEGESVSAVEEMAKKLGFDVKMIGTNSTIKVFQKYGYDLDAIKVLKFNK